jgi:hypothetical protein
MASHCRRRLRVKASLTKLPNKRSAAETAKRGKQDVGWEGDGTIQMMWLPPFVGAGVEDAHGVFIWHVKQANNGTSWRGRVALAKVRQSEAGSKLMECYDGLGEELPPAAAQCES